MASYSEFHSPVPGHVPLALRSGVQAGKQSKTSSNVRWRMMMLRRRAVVAPRRSNQAPRIVARASVPTIVVLSGTRMRMRADCAAADVSLAASSDPAVLAGGLGPHGPAGL